MAIFTRDELYSLLAPQSPPCISILMPTHRHHPGTEQDPIRFKNLLKAAAALLESRAADDVRGLLDPIAALPDSEFWRHQSDGLAIFRSRDRMAHYRIPMELPERVVVADSRSPRDGRFIENLGRYNPQTEPSTIVLNEERIRYWISKGAQPSEPVRKLMKTQGIS